MSSNSSGLTEKLVLRPESVTDNMMVLSCLCFSSSVPPGHLLCCLLCGLMLVKVTVSSTTVAACDLCGLTWADRRWTPRPSANQLHVWILRVELKNCVKARNIWFAVARSGQVVRLCTILFILNLKLAAIHDRLLDKSPSLHRLHAKLFLSFGYSV